MKALILASAFVLALSGSARSAQPQPQPRFVTIGSGDTTAVYFPTGLTIAKLLNRARAEHAVRASVESTRGSVYNINAILAGYLEFGFAQSDKQFQAVRGLAEWEGKGPQAELRSVFRVHDESLCLVAAADAGIQQISDLKGKRVNLGNPGSGQFRNSLDALEAVGLDPDRHLRATKVPAREAPTLLADGRIDAFFCTVGHPSATLREAASGPRKIRFIPIDGPGVQKLIADRPYYTSTTVAVEKLYPGAEGPPEVQTLGVFATLSTSARVPDDVVYSVTKAVLENFDFFRSQHPAHADLTKKKMVEALPAPLHPGAVRYFGEAGLIP